MDSPDEVFLTTDEYAARRRTSHDVLQVERSKGCGPAYVKYGSKVLYPLSEVLRFERERLVRPGAEKWTARESPGVSSPGAFKSSTIYTGYLQ